MKRIVKYDLLRIVSSFAIVLLHVSASYWNVVDVGSKDFVTMTIYNSFTRFGVPVFFMLSGLFLLDPEKSFSWRKWRIKILKLIVCFYIWSLFYAFQSVLFNGFLHGWSSIDHEMWSNAITRLVIGHVHMWFLWDLLGFYLMIPVLRKICEDVRVQLYFLLLWVIIQFIIVIIIPNLWDGRLLAVVTNMHLYILMGYIGYFSGGYFLIKLILQKDADMSYICLEQGQSCLQF